MENTEKKKGLLVLVIFLILVVVCLSGYTIYDKVFDKEKGVEPKMMVKFIVFTMI